MIWYAAVAKGMGLNENTKSSLFKSGLPTEFHFWATEEFI